MAIRHPGLLGRFVWAAVLALWMSAALLVPPALAKEYFGEAITKSAAYDLETKSGTNTDPAVMARVRHIGDRIAAVADLGELQFRFTVINDPTFNALSLPWNYVYVHQGLLNMGMNDDELAFILGHEVGHNAHQHVRKRIEQSIMLAIGIAILTGGSSETAQMAAALVANLYSSAYSRDNEREADATGIEYMSKAGYDPRGAIGAFQKMKQYQDAHGGSGGPDWLSDHPLTDERLRTAEEAVSKYSYTGPPPGRDIPRRSQPRILVLLPFDPGGKGSNALQFLADRLTIQVLMRTAYPAADYRAYGAAAQPSGGNLASYLAFARAQGAEYALLTTVDECSFQGDSQVLGNSQINGVFADTAYLYNTRTGALVASKSERAQRETSIQTTHPDYETWLELEYLSDYCFTRQVDVLGDALDKSLGIKPMAVPAVAPAVSPIPVPAASPTISPSHAPSPKPTLKRKQFLHR